MTPDKQQVQTLPSPLCCATLFFAAQAWNFKEKCEHKSVGTVMLWDGTKQPDLVPVCPKRGPLTPVFKFISMR